MNYWENYQEKCWNQPLAITCALCTCDVTMSTEAPPSYFGGTTSIVHEQFLVKYGGAASGLLLLCLAKMTVQLYWRRVTFSTLESQALISSSLKFHFISHIYQKYMGFPSQPEHFRLHIVTSYATFHSQFIWLGHIEQQICWCKFSGSDLPLCIYNSIESPQNNGTFQNNSPQHQMSTIGESTMHVWFCSILCVSGIILKMKWQPLQHSNVIWFGLSSHIKWLIVSVFFRIVPWRTGTVREKLSWKSGVGRIFYVFLTWLSQFMRYQIKCRYNVRLGKGKRREFSIFIEKRFFFCYFLISFIAFRFGYVVL